ncbi:MAG TPA: DUF456 domain-containing protein [Balneolaceae bacterium]|nr:DUF456 domain-containing protein [Balneolaceae bacterium]
MFVGFIGSFLPILPGLPLSYLGLIALQLTSKSPFSITFFLIWALIVATIMILDNIIPAYGTKKFGGSSYGVWGSVIGMLAGLFFAPVGIVVGPLVGAFLGELIAGQTSGRAIRSAWGSFIGLLGATIIKVIISGIMGYYFFINL